ncbi:MAG: Uma2 family endonuclease [Proteobacteria bacterium]|nr:Uma2 family endonuclease [Pseudomonadota bacterium]
MTASVPLRVVLTYEDYRRLPDDGRRYELFEGEVYVTPAPLVVHQRISRNLEFQLHRYVQQHGLGEVLDAPVDVILGRTTVLQPDLLYVSRKREAIVTRHGVEGPPDLVIEILSDSTRERDRGVKQQLYARHGVAHYWIVDPATKTVAEHVLEEGGYVLLRTYVANDVMAPALFPELAIDLATVFPP